MIFLDMGANAASMQRIHVPKTSEIVADNIRAQIIRGELNEGDSLPPEGQLMDSLGISRPTLREAFRILEAEGLISVMRGSRTGAKVHKPSVDLVSRYAGYLLEAYGTTVSDLYQARLAIEPTVVRWLAEANGKTEGMAALHRLLEQMREMAREGQYADFIDAVSTFHQMLVEASGSKTLSFMSRMLLNLARTHQAAHLKRHPTTREEQMKSIKFGLASYDKLVSLIESGKVEDAVAHWRLHLRNANKAWTGDGAGNMVVDSLAG